VLGKGYINTPQRGLAAHDSVKPPRNNFYLKLSFFFFFFSFLLKLGGLFIGSKQALEALGNLEKLDFNLLVTLGSNPFTNWNRIHPDLPPSLAGQFWHSGSPIYENPISS
jgi:hypothetical protein